MGIVPEPCRHSNQPAVTLHVDLLRAVHENVADRQVSEKGLDGTEAGDLVEKLFDDFLTVRDGEGRRLFLQQLDHNGANLGVENPLVGDLLECFEVEALDQLPMKLYLDTIDR